MASWFTHVQVDEAAQGRSSSNTYVVATIQAPEIDDRSLFPANLGQEGSKSILEETHSIPLWPGSSSDKDERNHQVLFSSLSRDRMLSYPWANVCSTPHVVIYVLSS